MRFLYLRGVGHFRFNKHYFALCCWFFLSMLVFTPLAAQNEHVGSPQAILPSSEAMAIAKHVAIPTGHYTGMPNISIPVFELAGKDISVPLSLRYHAATDREAAARSWVGEDWMLDGVGLITRVINGISDFDPQGGYIGSSLPANLTEATSDFINKAINGTTDTGPDIFYFSFGGYRGKFMFTPEGDLITDPSNHLKIEPIVDELGEWVVKDAKGYQYIFGGTNAVEQISKNGVDKLAVTGWYLVKIISPLKEEVVFDYEEPALIENKYYNDATIPGTFISGTLSIANKSLEIPRYHFVPCPKGITLDQEKSGTRLLFKSLSDLPNLPNVKMIHRVIIQVKDGDEWKQTGYVDLGASGIIHYNSEQTGTVPPPSPTESWDFVTTPVPGSEPSVSSQRIASTHIAYTTIDGTKLISEIKYNSGKKIKYFFEPHDFSNYQLSAEDQQKLRLGYRLERVVVEGEEPLETFYYYLNDQGNSSGSLNNFTAFNYDVARWVANGGVYEKVNGTAINSHVTPLFNTVLGGPLVTYSHVQTESAQKGKVTYEYTRPVSPATIVTNNEGYYNESFAMPLSGIDFIGGKLKETKVYKVENDVWHVIKQNTWQYEETARPALEGANLLIIDAAGDQNVNNAAATISGNNSGGQTISFRDITGIQTYAIPVSWSRLSRSIDTYSETAGISKVSTTNYEYNSDNFPVKTTTVLANGVAGYSTTTYPFDYPGEPVYDEMVARNMLAYTVETLSYRKEGSDEFIVGGSISDFGFFMDNDPANDQQEMLHEYILPRAAYSWENTKDGASPESEIPSLSSKNYKLGVEFRYDAHANLIETSGKHKVATTIFDYKNELPIAEVINASADDVYMNGFEEDGTENQAKTGLKSHEGGQFTIPFTPQAGTDYLLSYWYYSEGQWYYREKAFDPEINEGEALDEIRVYPFNSRMSTTAYDWKGNVVSSTDANNHSMYYDYNKMNQVTNVRNNDRDIVQTIQHNYSYIGACEEENVQPIQAYFAGGDNITVDSDADHHELQVISSGGCGKRYYNWYITDAGDNEKYIGTTLGDNYKSLPLRIFSNLCKEFFTVKCEVVDEFGTGMVTIRKHVRVIIGDLGLTLEGDALFPTNYCTINGDQMVVRALPGGCGPYSYHWTYTYHDENTSQSVTITKTGPEFIEKFLGPGTLRCTVNDSIGRSASVTKTIGQDKDCLN